jgi:hypothetical protein
MTAFLSCKKELIALRDIACMADASNVHYFNNIMPFILALRPAAISSSAALHVIFFENPVSIQAKRGRSKPEAAICALLPGLGARA